MKKNFLIHELKRKIEWIKQVNHIRHQILFVIPSGTVQADVIWFQNYDKHSTLVPENSESGIHMISLIQSLNKCFSKNASDFDTHFFPEFTEHDALFLENVTLTTAGNKMKLNSLVLFPEEIIAISAIRLHEE